MKVAKSYKVELDPTNRQRTAFIRHAGAARFAYNWGVERWRKMYEAGGKPDPMRLHKALNAIKESDFPWMYEVSKCAMQEALIDLGKAFKNFFKKRAKYPKFKSRHRSKLSFRLTSPKPMKLTPRKIWLPVIGEVRLKERDYIPVGTKVTQATVSERAGRWYVSVKVEEDIQSVETTGGEVLGVDLGVKVLATCSDDTVYENPKRLKASMKRIKGLSRKMARQKKGSKSRARTKHKLAKAHARVADQRRDAVHKMTTDVVRTKRPSVVVVEDLNVRGMVKNHRLAGAVSDVAMGEARRQLDYKPGWYGVHLVVADRWFPSTKMCSCCGALREMTLGDRVYACSCGNTMDRDLNASLNLKKYGEDLMSSQQPPTSSAEYAGGATVRPQRIVAGCREASTRH